MKNRSRLGSLGALVLLAVLVAPQVGYAATPTNVTSAATNTAGSTGKGVIVFQVSSGGVIYTVGANGKNLRYLTTGMDPALSPDGKQVAFTRWDGQGNGASGSLWVINIDGTGERRVMAGANQPKSPTWSPDGTQIVISMQHGGTLSSSIVCMSGGGRPGPGGGCRVVAADPWWALRRVNVATGVYEDLASDTHSFAPTWDPANAWHVVFRGDKGLESLDLNLEKTWTLNANGVYRGPVFSPDGSKIAVTFKQNDHWEVHVMNADGSGEVRLTETPASVLVTPLAALMAGKAAKSWNNAAPAWSPDGKQIAFLSDRNGAYEIWVMNADGSNQHVLVTAAKLSGAGITYEGMDERVISWR